MSYEDSYFDSEKRKITLHFRSLKELLDAIAAEKGNLIAVREKINIENKNLEKIKEACRGEEQSIIKMKHEADQQLLENKEKVSDMKSEIVILESQKKIVLDNIETLKSEEILLQKKKQTLVDSISSLEAVRQNTIDLTAEKKKIEGEIEGVKKEKSIVLSELQSYEPQIKIKKEELVSLHKKRDEMDIVLKEKGEALDMINAMIRVAMRREKVRQMKDILNENYGKDS